MMYDDMSGPFDLEYSLLQSNPINMNVNEPEKHYQKRLNNVCVYV